MADPKSGSGKSELGRIAVRKVPASEAIPGNAEDAKRIAAARRGEVLREDGDDEPSGSSTTRMIVVGVLVVAVVLAVAFGGLLVP